MKVQKYRLGETVWKEVDVDTDFCEYTLSDGYNLELLKKDLIKMGATPITEDKFEVVPEYIANFAGDNNSERIDILSSNQNKIIKRQETNNLNIAYHEQKIGKIIKQLESKS